MHGFVECMQYIAVINIHFVHFLEEIAVWPRGTKIRPKRREDKKPPAVSARRGGPRGAGIADPAMTSRAPRCKRASAVRKPWFFIAGPAIPSCPKIGTGPYF